MMEAVGIYPNMTEEKELNETYKNESNDLRITGRSTLGYVRHSTKLLTIRG